ncbi:probable Alpha-ketoglutarate-dependent sulfonate dioxygenase [Zygosaccharomyces bailii]|nr:probable Alpha-ketoglutarate-dependent sulfonate dioxygenase [Zygosaccharomyces bailii]
MSTYSSTGTMSERLRVKEEEEKTIITERLHYLQLNVGESNGLYGNFDTHFYGPQDEVSEDGILRINPAHRATTDFPAFLPTWDPQEKYPPLSFHKYNDPALRADVNLSNLFPKKAGQRTLIKKITPKLGSEVRGVQLSQLSHEAKDELALFVAQRGVVVFRDQDFGNRGPEFAVEYGKHFGKLHIHQTSGHPEGIPELHITYRRPDHDEFDRVFQDQHSSISWHTDVSYELQPPSYTFFSVLQGPDGGGDTLFADSVEAYERLSPTMKAFVGGLHVIHSSVEQAENSKSQGGVQRRESTGHVHPLVRYHPVLKRKSLFVNQSFSRRVIELKKPESDLLLNFLYKLIRETSDLQLRAAWEPNSVTVWDNRRVHHSAVIDWDEPVKRHAFRITPQGERPVESEVFLNDPNYFPNSTVQY